MSLWQVEVRDSDPDFASKYPDERNDWRPSIGRAGLTEDEGQIALEVAQEELDGLFECRLVVYSPNVAPPREGDGA